MSDNLFPVVVRRFIVGLIGSFILAPATLPFAVQAHTGISEDIEEVSGRIQDDPEAPELYLLRGELHRINGHWSEAIADFRKVQQIDPGNAAADLGMGRTYLDQGLYSKAINHLDRTLAKQPGNVRGLVTRAKALRLLGEPLAAAEDYKRAIDSFQEPQKPIPGYYFERARAFEAAGLDYIGAALQTLDAGISRLGNIWILEDYATDLERKRHNYHAALLRLDRMIDRSARKEALLMRRGAILMEADRPAEAEANFAAARDAIDALPPQRRQTRSMKQLQTDIDSQTHYLKQQGGRK
jgi:predicted Zn-dependent protease